MNYNYRNIDINEVFKEYENYFIVDVRSPIEFIKDSLHGSINIPLLQNIERHIIGTIFKEKGFKKAKEYGEKIISPNINNKLNKIYNEFVLSKKKKF